MGCITAFVVCSFLLYIWFYCSDAPIFWSNKYFVNIVPPSLNDLVVDETERDIDYIRDQYIKNVISPSTSYFDLHNEMKQRETPSSDRLFSLGAIYLVTLYIAFLSLDNIGVSAVVAFIIMIISWLIAGKVYNNTLRLIPFQYTPDQLNSMHNEECAKHTNNLYIDYPISDSASFNIYALEKHHEFLINIKDSVRFRRSVYLIFTKISTVIAAIIVILSTLRDFLR